MTFICKIEGENAQNILKRFTRSLSFTSKDNKIVINCDYSKPILTTTEEIYFSLNRLISLSLLLPARSMKKRCLAYYLKQIEKGENSEIKDAVLGLFRRFFGNIKLDPYKEELISSKNPFVSTLSNILFHENEGLKAILETGSPEILESIVNLAEDTGNPLFIPKLQAIFSISRDISIQKRILELLVKLEDETNKDFVLRELKRHQLKSGIQKNYYHLDIERDLIYTLGLCGDRESLRFLTGYQAQNSARGILQVCGEAIRILEQRIKVETPDHGGRLSVAGITGSQGGLSQVNKGGQESTPMTI